MTAPAVTQPALPAVPPASPERRADDFTTRMIAEHGSIENALRATATRMFAAQDSLATVTGERDTLSRRLPEGSVVLPKAEAESFAKLQALGTPAEIEAKVKKAGELEGTVAATALEKLAKDAAAAAQFDPDAFAAHAAAKGLYIELKDTPVIEAGKTVTKKVPHVRPAANAAAPLVPLTDYAGTLPAFEQRALKATAPVAPVGPEYPAQRPTQDSPSTGDKVGDFLAKRNAAARSKPNPLFPARPATQPVATS